MTVCRSIIARSLASVLVLFVATTAFAQDPKPADPKPLDLKPKVEVERKDAKEAAPPMNEHEQAFSDRMANSVLIGKFTVAGKPDAPPKTERYEIESVTRGQDDYWVFLARIKYGEHDVKVPMTLKVLWAGDTPMVSLTDFTIPGLGTFTSRVLFYEDRYAGTWQHGKVGGHLFGTIEKSATPPVEPPADAAKKPAQP